MRTCMAVILLVVMTALTAGAGETVVLQPSGVRIPLYAGTVGLSAIETNDLAGDDVSAIYELRDVDFMMSVNVYPAAPGTEGPLFLLDEKGERIWADEEYREKHPNSVFKLTEPSASYDEEYQRVLAAIDGLGWKLCSEMRRAAQPKQNDMPIAKQAIFSASKRAGNRTADFTWMMYLYTVPGYFIKIHVTCPDAMWLDMGSPDVSLIESINWEELLRSRPMSGDIPAEAILL